MELESSLKSVPEILRNGKLNIGIIIIIVIIDRPQP